MNGIYKKYVDVDVEWKKDGTIVPTAIIWGTDQGIERYEIDRILSGPSSRASAAGGVGKRYEVLIQKHKRNLFLEKDKWFVESVR
ncbi:MAG: hypothetical protein IJ225_08600 [Solobacterium sp.]|nr:hypothetical protein [Solobacterium sp.]